jgi:hypothetical protein
MMKSSYRIMGLKIILSLLLLLSLLPLVLHHLLL